MKNYIFIFFCIFSIAFSVAQDRIPGEPIPGADVKVGRKPPGGNHVAQGKTGADGTYEFKNLPSGRGYFVTVDFAIKEQGVKSTSQTIEIADIELAKTTETYTKKMKEGTGKPQTKDNKTANNADEYEIVLTVTAGNGTIKGRYETVKNSISNIR